MNVAALHQGASALNTAPSVAELLNRAAKVSAIARERAQDTEKNRQVSAELADMLRRAARLRILLPRAVGGVDCD